MFRYLLIYLIVYKILANFHIFNIGPLTPIGWCLALYRSEGLPERGMESLRMMGWGLVVEENSSAVAAAAPRGGGGGGENFRFVY